jgi:acyl carrier protein
MARLAGQEVLAELQPIFEEAMDVPGLVVTCDSSALNTPNWDSLAHIEMIELVERRFSIRFALNELQDLKTVGDLVRLIVSREGKV